MARRLKLHEVSLEDDIRYRGPISFQGFQVLGWLCIVVSVALAILEVARKLDPLTAEVSEKYMPIIRTVAGLSVPLFLPFRRIAIFFSITRKVRFSML